MGRGTPLWGLYGSEMGVYGPLRGVLGSPCWVLGSLEDLWGLYGVLRTPLWGFGGPYGVGDPPNGVNVVVKLGCMAL